ncbi:hypothetical protein ACHAXT_005768 [Thalassiosira profunda]
MLMQLKNHAFAFSGALKGGAASLRRLPPLKHQKRCFALNAAAALAHEAPTKSDLDRELNTALHYAREVDKRHGLCSEPSQRAWSHVDDIYRRMEHSQKGSEHSSARSQMDQHMPRRNSGRKAPRPANRITMTAGSRYYYF